jgi:predicted MFS family arabinose efflux permease
VAGRLSAAGRPGLQALHFGGVGLGIAVSSLMTAALFSRGAGWQAGWWWAGGLSFAGFLAVVALVRGGPLGAGSPVPEGRLPRSPALVKLILAYGLFGLGYIVTATFLVAIVRQGGGSPLFESTVWLITGLAGMPSVWLWGQIAKRLGLARTVAAGCMLEAVGVFASVGIGGSIGPIVGGLLLGVTFIAITALGLQAGRLLAPEAPRRALAVMTAAFGIGQILGPLMAGVLADLSGSYLLPSCAAAVVLFSCAAIMLALRNDPRLP